MKLIMILGYLGSGKTTLVSNILESFKNEKNGVLINDFGAMDVDGLLFEEKDIALKKVYDGSIFCTCKSDKFVEGMLELICKQVDNIIVEASGLANPNTMLRELSLIEEKGNVKFDLQVFTVVDAINFEKMVSMLHAVKTQVALSDVILLNKVDLADAVKVERVEKLLSDISPAKVIKTTNAKLNEYFGYEKVEKPKITEIMDLNTQKALINLKLCNLEQLDSLAYELSKVSHRIKGAVKLDGKNYLYEYVDGEGKLREVDKDNGSYLVVLSLIKTSLKKEINNILKDIDYGELSD